MSSPSSAAAADTEPRWLPTHAQVTVLRARGLRAKGKQGTSDAYAIIQLAKEKYSTRVADKSTAPEWREECTFELQPGALEGGGGGELVLTVMHRALIGLDVFLGQAVVRLEHVYYREGRSVKNEWYRLNSKTGKKEKERGEIQVSVQFTRNNLTASMYELVMQDKGAFGFSKLRDRIKLQRRRPAGADNQAEVVDPVVAPQPSGYDSLCRMRQRLPSDGGGEEDYEDDEGGEVRRSKMRSFFLRGKLRKSSDTRSSSTSLGSESSESSSRGGSLSPTAGISVVVSDLSNSPSNSSNLTADGSPEHSANMSPKSSSSLQCEFGDDAGEISIVVPQLFNGGHAPSVLPQPPDPGSGKPGPLLVPGLKQKPLTLSASLQNLNLRGSAHLRTTAATTDGRRWSFDEPGEEEKAAIVAALERSGPLVAQEEEEEEGKKKEVEGNLFPSGRSLQSGGRSHSQEGEESGVAGGEERHTGWFGSKDSHSKPSPHPVKPLTAAVPAEEKRVEGRGVLASGLEKLRSTISPARSSPEQEGRKKTTMEGAGSYYHLSHSELVALLVRREAELQRQRAESEQQRRLLAKRELELRRLKPQVRDLEDYIDTLLVRIMEQTPTLLQVRTKLK